MKEKIKQIRRKFFAQFAPLWLREQLKNIQNTNAYIIQRLDILLSKNNFFEQGFNRSQSRQDLFVAEYFKGKPKGTYLEAGAFDGKTLSNTYFLEKILMWSGILIEPLELEYNKISENRNKKNIIINTLLSSEKKEMYFTNEGPGSYASDSHKGGACMTSEKLENIFNQYNITQIDYCSLDIEGHELEALKGIDFKKVNITLFGIESNSDEEALEILEFMEDKNYAFIRRIGQDYFYEKCK